MSPGALGELQRLRQVDRMGDAASKVAERLRKRREAKLKQGQQEAQKKKDKQVLELHQKHYAGAGSAGAAAGATAFIVAPGSAAGDALGITSALSGASGSET